MTFRRIPPRSGTAFQLEKGEILTVRDVQGVQVADLLAYSRDDVREVLSSGRTIDFAESIRLTTGNVIYSNRSNPMLTIIEDTVGIHDFLLTPCSEATFRHFYPTQPTHRGCFGNLAEALSRYGIPADSIPVAFNIFMNVEVTADGSVAVLPPISRAGDYIQLRAEMPLIIGLTACSAYSSNGGSFKPIEYLIAE